MNSLSTPIWQYRRAVYCQYSSVNNRRNNGVSSLITVCALTLTFLQVFLVLALIISINLNVSTSVLFQQLDNDNGSFIHVLNVNGRRTKAV